MNLPQALPQGWWIIYKFDELFEKSLDDWHYPVQDQLEEHYLFCVQSAQSALKELRNDMDFIQENRRYKRRTIR